ncbi:MAG: FecR domain-containing protein [Opitutus sp.]
MNRGNYSPADDERLAQAAADWVLRSDRGLSAAEQDEFSQWLATDPRHGAALARQRQSWDRLATLAQWRPEHGLRPNPDLLAPPRRNVLKFAAPIVLAIAALIAVVFVLQKPAPLSPSALTSVPSVAPESIRQQTLADGTLVILNEGAVLRVDFTPQERRVTLEAGEAHFAVTKNPARPFVVRAQGMDVFAVGTAFNVRLDRTSVEVLVTEGRVRVSESAIGDQTSAHPATPALVPLLEAGQRAVVSLADKGHAPRIAVLTEGEIDRVLSWQHRLLDFTDTPLSDVVNEFNRRNRTQLVIVDPELATIRISASFRSDNIEAFVRLIEVGFSLRIERDGESQIRLHRAP